MFNMYFTAHSERKKFMKEFQVFTRVPGNSKGDA